MRNVIARLGRRVSERVLDAAATHRGLREKTSPTAKIALKALYMSYRSAVHKGDKLPSVSEAGFRVFSQFDEDGIVVFLLGAIGIGPAKFVDIGAGDGMWASNAANLAFNLGFHGLFIDADLDSIARGRAVYQRHEDTSFYPPRFQHATATTININQIMRDAGFQGEIDLLSIDIDGNDYWIWDAIDCVSPRIVVIETHVEFGLNSIVVPYEETHDSRRGGHPHYLGASPMAMTKLAKKLGYRLVGANRFGFNAFYVRNDLGQGVIPEVEVSELLRHERNRERVKLFDDIKGLKYESV